MLPPQDEGGVEAVRSKSDFYSLSKTHAIIKMKSLKELGVKDTKVSLFHLANILNVGVEMTSLDFSFQFEEDWKNLQAGLKKVILDSMALNFKRLTCFKVSTCVDDARDYRHDPWQPILQFLR